MVTVLVAGVTSMFFLLALSSIVTSAVRTSASNKWTEGLRNAAEIGIDYTVDRFNKVYPCPLDPTESGSLVTALPESELQSDQVNGVVPNSGVPNVKVSIKVTRLDALQWQKVQGFCSAYCPQFDPTNSESLSYDSPASTNLTMASGGGLRVVESTATNGVVSRTIRVVLRAHFGNQPDTSHPLESGGSTPLVGNYFQRPFFGNSSVSISNNMAGANTIVSGIPVKDSIDEQVKATHWDSAAQKFSTFNLNVATNRFASIGAGSTVQGDVTVTSKLSGTTNVITAADGKIQGRALANGNVDSFVADAADGGNVQARADIPATDAFDASKRLGLNDSAPVVTPGSADPYQTSPIATPSSATPLSDLSGYTSSSTSPTANGDSTFETSSLSTANVPTGKSVVFNNGDSSPPVRIFVDPGGVDSLAVNIDTSKISTTTPANYSKFQIWYDGNKPVNINMTSNFNGLIYAPNAPVNIFGAGDFTGALVGKNLNVSPTGNLNLKIDTALGTSAGGGGGGSSAGLTFKYRLGEGTVIQGWQPISWQEFGTVQ